MSKTTIFLTGTTGFIGKNLHEQLEDKYLFFAPTHKDLDLTDTVAIDKFFDRNKVDIVIHCANVGGNRSTPYIPDAVEKNLKMFFNLVRQKDKVKKMIHMGSGAEYDKRFPIVSVTEEDFGKRIPVDQYGFTKYVCSQYAKEQKNILVLRLFGVFGKYEDYKTRFISESICRSLLGKPIILQKNVYFDYLYINDLVKIIEHFIEHTSEENIFNVGRGEKVDLLTLAKKIRELNGGETEILIKEDGLQNEYTCNTAKLRKELGGFNFTDYDQSLNELYTWYSSQKTILKQFS